MRKRISGRALVLGYAAIALGLGGALGWLALRNINWGEVASTLATPRLPLVLVAVAAGIAAGYLRGLRWSLLLPKSNSVRPWRLFLIEQTGSALDTLSPVRVLDEVVETGILTVRDGVPLGTVLATIALQRTLEFGTTVLLLGCGALLLPPLREFWPYLTAGILTGGIAIALLFIIGPALSKVKPLSTIPIIPQFASGVGFIRNNPDRAAFAFLLSLAQAALIGLSGWIVGVATGVSLGVVDMIVITLGIQFFSSTVPGLPMALGTFEFAAISLLRLWGFDAAPAGAFAVMLHVVIFAPTIIFALFFLPREGLLSVRQLRDLAAARQAEEVDHPSRSPEPALAAAGVQPPINPFPSEGKGKG